jgi:glycogen debranching enzyme
VLLGFSPANTPHLAPAFELDTAILELSGKLASKGLPTRVNSEGDIDVLVAALHEEMKALNLWQYYVLNVESEKEGVKTALASGSVKAWEGPAVAEKTVVELAEIVRSSGKVEGLGQFSKRFGVRVDGAVAAGLVQAAFVALNGSPDQLAEAWGRVVDVLNVDLYKEWTADTDAALEQVKGRIRYTRLDAHGPRLGEISKEYVRVHSEFECSTN